MLVMTSSYSKAVEEYEMLLGEMTGELEELRVQTKFLRESELSQENLMQEYEGENQRLLDELDDIRALHSERKSPETALEDLPDAMTADMLAKAARVAEKTAAEAVARAEAAEERCATATKDAADVKELAHALERDLEEVGEQLREETEGKEAAIADLHNVVDEITAEEERLLDEIELLKSVDSNRVITFRRTERELKLELETAQEEKDALATELEEIRRSRTASFGGYVYFQMRMRTLPRKANASRSICFRGVQAPPLCAFHCILADVVVETVCR